MSDFRDPDQDRDDRAAAEPEEHLERPARPKLDAIARAAGRDVDQLQLLTERRTRFEHLGASVSIYKVLDRSTGEAARFALDDEGRRLDPDELLHKELVLARDRYGSLQPALHETVRLREGDAGSGGEEPTIAVMIKYSIAEDDDPFDKREVATDDDSLERAHHEAEQHVRRTSEQARELHRQVLAQRDVRTDDEPPTSGPFVRARLPVGVIRDLARDERIAFIGLDDEQEIPDYPTIPESLPTTRTNTVHGTGVRGAGIKIAVLEGGTLTSPSACFNVVATQDTGASPNSHMTKSVAIIGNRYDDGECRGDWQGYAPDASVYLANTSYYTDRYDWARARGVNVVTMSWHYPSEETSGSLHSRDEYFDYWVLRWPYPSVFTSAGNEAAEDAYSSGKGYNFFGVANVLNDGDGDRCNDAISSSSSWKNPTTPHRDREVPEIAAPGSRHALLGTSFGGTSCATPVAASIAALLMSKNTRLKIWPEAIRAIMLATANFQGADGAEWRSYLDGKDGTGLVNSLYGMWTAGRRETGRTPQFRAHDYGQMRHDDFRHGYFEKSWFARTITTACRIRVAITWNSRATSETSSVLDADLDLWVHDPDGNLVAWSGTWDSNYEFVEFTPSKIGSYEIRIRGFSVPSTFVSWYGVAWTAHYDLCR